MEHETDNNPDDALARMVRDAFPKPDVPRDAMWREIERVRAEFSRPAPTLIVHRTTYRRRFLTVAAGVAATLLVGIGIGRMTRAPASPQVGIAASVADDAQYTTPDTPRRIAMDAHLARTEVLLTSLRSMRERDASNAELSTAAQALLGTTRQLLDDPALSDGTTRTLLLDLELVLAQMVQDAATRQPDVRRTTEDAVIRMNLLPRLRASGPITQVPTDSVVLSRGVAE
jgi:hypothetical protein